ncbi:MAG: hypothetical protein Q8Q76_08295 [Methylotenera sp.]|nr:hypothetical protein [Methylotenera sp.]
MPRKSLQKNGTRHSPNKGEQYHISMVTPLAEVGVILHDAFSEGNVVPATPQPRIHSSQRSKTTQAHTDNPL